MSRTGQMQRQMLSQLSLPVHHMDRCVVLKLEIGDELKASGKVEVFRSHTMDPV